MGNPPTSRVALIEEDPALLPVLRRQLDEHHLVDGYGSGATALAGLRRNAPDLVVLSTTLDDAHWAELLPHLPHGVPVVAMSRSNDEAERERCLEAGCADHLVKPLSDEALLLATIATCLEQPPMPRREQRANRSQRRRKQ